MPDKSEVIVLLVEEMRPKLEEKLGKFHFKIRDGIAGTANLITEDEKVYVLAIFGDDVLLAHEEDFVDERVPELKEQLVYHCAMRVENSVKKLAEQLKWETTWSITLKNPNTGRCFIVTMGNNGGLAIVPEEML